MVELCDEVLEFRSAGTRTGMASYLASDGRLMSSFTITD